MSKCHIVGNHMSRLKCLLFMLTAQTCDVVVSINSLSKTLAGSYIYDAGLTPTISGVSPTDEMFIVYVDSPDM